MLTDPVDRLLIILIALCMSAPLAVASRLVF
jgi:hypothetical protein